MREIMPYIWMGIVIFAVIIKLHTRSLAFVGLALAGFCAFVLSLNETGQIRVWVQAMVFVGITVLLGILSWIVHIKSKKGEKKIASIISFVGKTAIVIEEINNYKNAGAIRVNGVTFGAKSEEDDIIYETGLVVTIVGVEELEECEEYDENSERAGELKAVCAR